MKIEFDAPAELEQVLALFSRSTNNDVNEFAKHEFMDSLRSLVEELNCHIEAWNPEIRAIYDYLIERQEQKKVMCEPVST